MRKARGDHPADDLPRRSSPRALLAIALGLGLAPLLFEGSTVVAGRWRAILGQVPPEAATPVSDAVGEALKDGSRRISAAAEDLLKRGGRHPDWAMGVAVAWAVLGGGFLMRNR